MTEANTPLDYFQRGYEAAANGQPRRSCPLLHDGWVRQCWYEGYNFYVKAGDYINAGMTAQASYEATRVAKAPYEQGRDAYGDGVHTGPSSCPYGPDTADNEDWCRGWRDAADAATARPQAASLGDIITGMMGGGSQLVLTLKVEPLDKPS